MSLLVRVQLYFESDQGVREVWGFEDDGVVRTSYNILLYKVTVL